MIALLGWNMAVARPDLVVTGEAWIDETRQPVTIVVDDGRIREIRTDGSAPRARRALSADLVTPGLVDAHAHPYGLGKKLLTLDLGGTASYAEVLARVESASAGKVASAGDWLLGRGWDQNDWADAPEGGWPLARDLDGKTRGPAALGRVDGHALWVNSQALRLSGVDSTTPDPPGGRILRDTSGAPTGVLVDEAMALVRVPQPTREQVAVALETAFREMLAHGLVGVHDMGVSDAVLAEYEALAASNRLPVRVWAYLDPEGSGAERLLESGPWSHGNLHVVGLKAFADGALGSRGALLREEYADEPGHSGIAITPVDRLADLATRCLAADAQLAVHAIGDLGVDQVLDAFEIARGAHPDKASLPLRLEHAQVVHPDDVSRFARLNVVASMQPTHATSDLPWAEARLGPTRVAWAYGWRTLASSGALLAFGSDFPVEDVDPTKGLWSATVRGPEQTAPPPGWHLEERLTLAEAVRAFTAGAADAVRWEGGRLVEGAPADLTLLAEEQGALGIRHRATATVVAGEVLWVSERP